MFFNRVLHKIGGYINIKIEGGNPEKFINLCTRNGIKIFNLRKDELAFYACAFISGEKHLDDLSKKCGTKITVTDRKGLPFVFARNRKRLGFFIGAAVFTAIIIYFSGFVWQVEINGNSSVSDREIAYTLDELGVSAGVRLGTFNAKSVEQEALLKLPGLSWMHINIDGNVAKVEVGERTNDPEIVADDIPCNIKAARDAQIIKIQVLEGAALFKPNDTVSEGEVIVSGIVEEPKTLITRYLHARAQVLARTNRTLSVSVPFKTSQLVDTGKVTDCYTFKFLNIQIPLYFNTPSGNYRRMIYKKPLVIFGNELPISVIDSRFCEYSEVPITLTKEQAKAKAKELMEQQEKTELCAAKIVSKKYTERFTKNGLVYTGVYVCEEDIGVTQEVEMNFK